MIFFHLLAIAVGGYAAMLPNTLLPVAEVVWLPEKGAAADHTLRFVGSPSIVKVPGTSYWLSSHDYFFDAPNGVVSVFKSTDSVGVDWEFAGNISAQYWAQLFVVNSTVYSIGCSGDLTGEGLYQVSRCTDVPCTGQNWVTKTILTPPSPHKCHGAPTPVIEVGGKLLHATEQSGYDGDLAVMVLEADVSCPDLTQGACWKQSNLLPFPGANSSSGRLWEEAGVVDWGNGSVSVMVRLDGAMTPRCEAGHCDGAAKLDYVDGKLEYSGIVPLPSGCNKFKIARDPATNLFYSLTNPTSQTFTCGQRNTLVLVQSKDLVDWKVCKTILYDDTGFTVNASIAGTGFQYVDWQFDGKDILAAVRAGYRGSVTFHDANRLLTTRIEDYATQC